jgi:hypothetical protein
MTGNQCQICAHYWGDLKCRAYPDGIPQKYLEGETHDKVTDDQDGEDVYKERYDQDGNDKSTPKDWINE